MAGATGGVLLGGWFADRSDRYLAFTVALTVAAAALLLLVSSKTMSDAVTLMVLLAAGLLVGASRTPRDVMLKDASPPGEIGKVFGFVSAGLPLGGALAPVPFGYLIDMGRPDLVLVLVAAVLLASFVYRHRPCERRTRRACSACRMMAAPAKPAASSLHRARHLPQRASQAGELFTGQRPATGQPSPDLRHR